MIEQQKKIRENAIQQANALLEYKRIICRHPSHVGPKGNNNNDGGILSIFVSLLAAPLSRTGNSRTDTDHLTIELILHLFRNILAAEPLVQSQASHNLHHELISLLDRELVLEILLVLAADIELRENSQYNLLLMELLQYLLQHQDPKVVARSVQQEPERQTSRVTASGSLLGKVQGERKAMMAKVTSRHSQFGGSLVVQRSSGSRKVMSAGLMGQASAPRLAQKRTKEAFVGARNKLTATGKAVERSAQKLNGFCKRFMTTCYGPVMKSLKNEFRRDSVRLEDGDRIVFFRIAWFFCQWWRTSGAAPLTDNSSIGHLIFTMDIFTFNLVLNATDTFQEHKKYAPLAQSVAFLSEMMHLLNIMYNAQEVTEKIMALGLMDRLFYTNEPLDRLPRLLSRWLPATSTREYLCDLAEVTHMTLKLLDNNAKACVDPSKNQSVAKMNTAAARFNVPTYFGRRLVSNQTVVAYGHLLSQYKSNSPQANHRAIAFFLRLTRHKLPMSQESSELKHPLAEQQATYEPLLYNVQMLTVLNTILNDVSIRKDPDFSPLLQFATLVVHNFSKATKSNPMLFVEALFKHSLPHRFCDSVTNNYVTEDVRLIVERDILLGQQDELDQQATALENAAAAGPLVDSDDDEELEFTDMPLDPEPVPQNKKKVSKKTKKTMEKRSPASLSDTDGEDEQTSVPSANAEASDSDDDDDVDELVAKRSKEQAEDLKKRIRALESDSSDEDESTSSIPTKKQRQEMPDGDKEDQST